MKKLGRLLFASVLMLGLVSAAQAVDFWTGGAGQESRSEAPNYNTAIQFFEQDGSYLADVWFTLYDGHGEVMLQGMTHGPWLFMDLDDGEYSLKGQRLATAEVQSIRFRVSGGDQLLGVRYHD